MAEPDIVQKVIIKTEVTGDGFEKAADGASAAAQAIAQLVEKSQGAAGRLSEILQTGDDFAKVTSSFSQLGDTGEQAFATLAEAAKKFGASAEDIRNVEGAINALNSRAEFSGSTFQQLAEAYDLARGVLITAEEAAAQAGTAITETGEAAGSAAQNTEALTEAAQGAGDALATVGEQGANAAGSIGEFGEITEEQAQQLADLAEALDGTLDSIAHLSTGLNTLAIAFARFGPAGQAVASALRTVSGILSVLDTSAGGLAPAIDKLAEALKKLGPAGQAAGEALERIIERMAEVFIKGDGLYGFFTRLG